MLLLGEREYGVPWELLMLGCMIWVILYDAMCIVLVNGHMMHELTEKWPNGVGPLFQTQTCLSQFVLLKAMSEGKLIPLTL